MRGAQGCGCSCPQGQLPWRSCFRVPSGTQLFTCSPKSQSSLRSTWLQEDTQSHEGGRGITSSHPRSQRGRPHGMIGEAGQRSALKLRSFLHSHGVSCQGLPVLTDRWTSLKESYGVTWDLPVTLAMGLPLFPPHLWLVLLVLALAAANGEPVPITSWVTLSPGCLRPLP